MPATVVSKATPSTAEELPIAFYDMELLQAQIDRLDLSFLYHIPVADGLFQLPEKDKKLSAEIDSDDDDSTVDLSNSSLSSRESSNLDLFFSDDTSQEDEEPSSEAPLSTVEETSSGGKSRPSLSTILSGSFDSFKHFKIKETDTTRAIIRTAALRVKIRQQKLRNEIVAQELEESRDYESALEVELHQSKVAAQDFRTAIHTTKNSDLRANLHHMKAHGQAVAAERGALALEAEAIRAQLGMNTKRLETLTEERNKQATNSLNLELMIAHMGIFPPGADHHLMSLKDLQTERDKLRESLGLSEGGSLADDESVNIVIMEENMEQAIENRKTIQELALKVEDLEENKYDLSEKISNLRTTLGQLEESRANQKANIEALKKSYLALADNELDVLDKRAEQAQAAATSEKKRRFKFSRIFGRRR